MKKLIPALCLLLVSAMMLGTSTFAWFSMNTTVTATGMTVSAKSDNVFLVIKEGSTFASSVTSTEVTSTASAVQLLPVAPALTLTSANVATPASWHYTYSDANDAYQKGENQTYHVCTDLANYVKSETFSIGLNEKSSLDASTNNLKLASVDIPDNSGISCVVVCGTVIGQYTADSSTPLDLGVKATKTGTTVTVYYFVNGEATSVYVDNIASLTGAITLEFSCD